MSQNRFQGRHYNLLTFNCNTFSNTASLYLTGRPIPREITNLPDDIMQQALKKILAVDDKRSKTFLQNVKSFIQSGNKYKEDLNSAFKMIKDYFN